MRIGTFNSTASELASEVTSQQAGAKSASKTGQAEGAQTGGEDRATFSSGSSSVDHLVNNALQSPEVRQDKVESLRQAVSSGQYKLDPSAIAKSMVDDYA